MEKFNDIPSPLRRKLLLTAILGFVCLLIGVAMFFFSKDRIMLLLSIVVCGLSMARAWSIFRLVKRKEYEVVEGVCVGVTPKPLRKYRKIRIIDADGNESSLLLDKQSKVKIGFQYRFYFKKTQRFTLGSEYFDTAMSSDCFLGYEELGEYTESDGADT